MVKNKILIAILLVMGNACAVFAQVTLSLKFNRNGIWEDHRDYAVCPGDVNYQIINWNSACHTITVKNGTPNGDVSSDGKIKINWQDTGDSCIIIVTKDSKTACDDAAPARNFFIPVLSLAKVKPTIEQIPPGPLDVGFIHNVKYVATAQYPWLGKKDSLNLDDFKLTEFVWTKPAGWTFNGSSQFETISVQTDLGTRGDVTAKAYNRKCLSSAGSSAAGMLKAERKMPSPCFSNGSLMASQYYELCGAPIQNTISCANLPINFEAPLGGVTYEWTVSPSDGWAVVSGGTNTAITYQTDGQKARTVTVKVTGYGVSSTCKLFIPLRIINPLAEVKGNKFFCEKDSFSLSHPVAPGANSTWKVESLTPNVPPSVSPTSGTGTSAVLAVTSGGANCRITFKIKGCNDSISLSSDFFAGNPIIRNMTIDGNPTNSASVCRGGYHFMSATPLGVTSLNTCLQWESLNGHPLNISCNTAQVWMPEAMGPPVIAMVTATNECGSTKEFFYLWPGQKCNGLPSWGLSISPNPATDMVSIQSINKETMIVGEETISELYIINQSGGIVFSDNAVQSIHQVQIGQLNDGIYTVRAMVNGEIITEPLLVKRQ